MLKPLYVSIFLPLLLLGMGVCADSAMAQDKFPIISSPEPRFDFGERDNSEKVVHTFKVVNLGTAPLEIKEVKTSCGCTVAELKKKVLQPGEDTDVQATFDLKGKQGSQTKHLTVFSNDPKSPAYKLTLQGQSVPAIKVEPALVNYGRIMDPPLEPEEPEEEDENAEEEEEKDPKEQVVTIKSNRDDLTFNITSVNCSLPQVEVTTETIEEGKHYELTAYLKDTSKPTLLTGMITIRTDNKRRPLIQVRITGQILGDLDIIPRELNITDTGDPGRKIMQYARISAGRIQEFEVLEATTDVEGVTIEIIPRGENNFQLKIENIPTTEAIKDKSIVLKTDIESTPTIEIPFRYIKRQPKPARPPVPNAPKQ